MDIDQPGEVIYVEIETRGEKRKRKNRNRQRTLRADKKLRNEMQNNRRKKARKTISLARDYQALVAGIPLRVLEMNEEFEQSMQKYANWPQPVEEVILREALAEFRNMTSPDELRELPCAVCSGLHSKDNWKQVAVQDIDLTPLKAPLMLTSPSFEIDFSYGHPGIDDNLKILLDRAGFIYEQNNFPENQLEIPYDLRVCHACYRWLKKDRTPPLSLANTWIGTTPPCLQGLTIPEQLLISPGYLCMNLIQLSNKRHNHHKLKGHVITLPQNPASLTKVLPLPMYKLCEHLKVVFVGQGKPTTRQLKKVLQVRKSRVTIALKWLMQHNILFKNNIQVDEDALNALPEGDIPEPLMVTTTTVNINPRIVEHYTGYTTDPTEKNVDEDETDSGEEDDGDNGHDHEWDYTAEDNTIGDARELRTSGFVNVDNVPISKKETTLLSLQNVVNMSGTPTDERLETITMDIDDVSLTTEPLHNQTIRMPHSNVPLNEYTDRTLFPAGFPVLFPYGIGGHEDDYRSCRLSLKKFADYLMRHRDPKFRQHRSFIFVVFNVLQRREVSLMAFLTAKGASFARSAELIATLTPNDIKLAIEQEQNKQSITNPALVELLRNVNAVGSKLMASHQSRARMRNEMRAVIIRDGAPSLFITINPADLHSPIVMMYAGKEIDLDNLSPENFPTATERSRLAHLDPSAVAKYFNVIITRILRTIIGYGKEQGGVFGPVKNYYGVVEYQDRGTPHCHMLVWLHGALDPITLRERLKGDEYFCERVLQYVSNIVREDISYLLPEGEVVTDDMLRAEYMAPKTVEQKRMHPSFFPIPDPHSPGFEEKFCIDLLAIVKRTLFHKCNPTCKKYNRGSQRNCRFDFPRELVEPPGIVFAEQGIIAVQRLNAFINNHNPYITSACRGNNDIKFISARKLALAYIHYITDYITKSDVSVHSSVLTCAATLETFLTKATDDSSRGHVDNSRKMVTKCLNKIAGQMELTSPQVSSYLLGLSDHYTPCKFVSIHLETFEHHLIKELTNYRDNNPIINCIIPERPEDEEMAHHSSELHENPDMESFVISSSDNRVMLTNLRVDYQFRGILLHAMCLYDYAATMTKIQLNSRQLTMFQNQDAREGKRRVDRFLFAGGDTPCNEHCNHTNIHPQHGTHIQIHRTKGQERVVMLCGKGIPKRDNQDQKERYGLCILLLFKPWRCVSDLIENYNSWAEACQAFLDGDTLSIRLRSVINNIELLHRCSDETALDRELREAARHEPISAKVQRVDRSVPGYDTVEELSESEDEGMSNRISFVFDEPGFNPDAIVRAGLKKLEKTEMTILPLRLRGRFNISLDTINNDSLADDICETDEEVEFTNVDDNVRSSTEFDENLLKKWKLTIASRKTADQIGSHPVEDDADLLQAYVESLRDEEQSVPLQANLIEDADPLEKHAAGLNDEQRKAFFLICDHRQRNHPDNPRKPSQLLLYLSGAGGTGKSRVIKAICDYFMCIGKRDTLLLLAPTGIAAANISGGTIHSLCGISYGDRKRTKEKPSSEEAQKRLEARWAKIEYVIIDEVSMLGQKLLAKFHACVQKAKVVYDNTIPFAGLNILFAGDFMQLPPVQDPALYMPNKMTRITEMTEEQSFVATTQQGQTQGTKRKQNDPSCITSGTVVNAIGRELWLSVKNVIQLKKQMRQIGDPFYASILENMRNGRLTQEQREALQTKIIGDDQIAHGDWKNAAFIVTRNEERILINFDATKEHAHDAQQSVIYSCAEDIRGGGLLTGRKRLKYLSVSDVKKNELCGILPLSIGMEVVITINICVNDSLANGTLGILRKIVYENKSVDHTCSQQGKATVLKNPPKYVIVELIDRTIGAYEDLPPNHVPIYPVQRACIRTVYSRTGNKIDKTFQRTQLPLTPAFAFTDFKCQGRTLKRAVVDLVGCSGRTNNSVYVMLSRVQKLEDLLILRPFPEKALNMKPSPALSDELARLDKCAQETKKLKQWP